MIELLLFALIAIIIGAIGVGIIKAIKLKSGYASNIPFIHLKGIPNLKEETEINLSFSPELIQLGDNYQILNNKIIGLDFRKTYQNKNGYLLNIHYKNSQENINQINLKLKSINYSSIDSIIKQINKDKNYIPQLQERIQL